MENILSFGTNHHGELFVTLHRTAVRHTLLPKESDGRISTATSILVIGKKNHIKHDFRRPPYNDITQEPVFLNFSSLFVL